MHIISQFPPTSFITPALVKFIQSGGLRVLHLGPIIGFIPVCVFAVVGFFLIKVKQITHLFVEALWGYLNSFIALF